MLSRMEVPVISTRGMTRIVTMLIPRELTRESNQFDMGYEAAKREFAKILGEELNIDFDSNPARTILRELRRRDG